MGSSSQASASIDSRAQAAAAAWAAGEKSEQEALWECAALYSQAKVATSVAREKVGVLYGHQVALDVAEQLDELVISKIVEQVGSPSNLVLERIAQGESLLGWARGLLRAAAPSEMRNHRRRRQYLFSPDDTEGQRGQRGSVADLMHEQSRDDSDDDRTVSIVEDFEARTWGTRPEVRTHERGRAAAKYLGIGTPRRVAPENREKVMAILSKRQNAAHAAVTRLANLAAGEHYEGARTDPVIEEIWAGYSPGELDTIANSDPLVAFALAEAASTPTLSLSKACRLRLRDWCVATNPEPPMPENAWTRLMFRLVRCYADMCSESVASHRASAPVPKAADVHAGECRAFDEVAAEVASLGVEPFGASVAEVTAVLDAKRDEIESGVAVEAENSRRFGAVA